MAELKTQKNDANVGAFIDAIEDPAKRADSHKLVEIFEEVTGDPAVMWGTSIIGFGQYHYKYESGREAGWMLVGFSPRKAAFSLYLTTGFDMAPELLAGLGKHKIGKGCLYITRLGDVDEKVLRKLISYSYKEMQKRWATA